MLSQQITSELRTILTWAADNSISVSEEMKRKISEKSLILNNLTVICYCIFLNDTNVGAKIDTTHFNHKLLNLLIEIAAQEAEEEAEDTIEVMTAERADAVEMDWLIESQRRSVVEEDKSEANEIPEEQLTRKIEVSHINRAIEIFRTKYPNVPHRDLEKLKTILNESPRNETGDSIIFDASQLFTLLRVICIPATMYQDDVLLDCAVGNTIRIHKLSGSFVTKNISITSIRRDKQEIETLQLDSVELFKDTFKLSDANDIKHIFHKFFRWTSAATSYNICTLNNLSRKLNIILQFWKDNNENNNNAADFERLMHALDFLDLFEITTRANLKKIDVYKNFMAYFPKIDIEKNVINLDSSAYQKIFDLLIENVAKHYDYYTRLRNDEIINCIESFYSNISAENFDSNAFALAAEYVGEVQPTIGSHLLLVHGTFAPKPDAKMTETIQNSVSSPSLAIIKK
jgi:hypothetical protein